MHHRTPGWLRGLVFTVIIISAVLTMSALSSLHVPIRMRPAELEPHNQTSMSARQRQPSSTSLLGSQVLPACPNQNDVCSDASSRILAVVPPGNPMNRTFNTVQIRWDKKDRVFNVSLAHWKPSSKDVVIDIGGKYGRTGNAFKQCMAAVFEGAMCHAVARCRELGKQEWNVYGIVYIDARGDGGRRPCRLFRNAAEAHTSSILPSEANAFADFRTVIGRAILGYFGAERPGVVFGMECDRMLQQDLMLVGHVRGGDLFRKGEVWEDVLKYKGQPPLKFFTVVIDKYANSRIYCEDTLKHVARILEQSAKATQDRTVPGKELQVRISKPFRAVLFDLLCAANVVMGESTMTTVVGASWNLGKLYLAADCDEHTPFLPAPPCATFALPVDNYTVFQSFDGTAQQLAQMVDHHAAIVPSEARQCRSRACAVFPERSELYNHTRSSRSRAEKARVVKPRRGRPSASTATSLRVDSERGSEVGPGKQRAAAKRGQGGSAPGQAAQDGSAQQQRRAAAVSAQQRQPDPKPDPAAHRTGTAQPGEHTEPDGARAKAAHDKHPLRGVGAGQRRGAAEAAKGKGERAGAGEWHERNGEVGLVKGKAGPVLGERGAVQTASVRGNGTRWTEAMRKYSRFFSKAGGLWKGTLAVTRKTQGSGTSPTHGVVAARAENPSVRRVSKPQ